MTKIVNASGAVVLRGKRNHREVLVVHRPSYDDWSLPKGKMLPDEYLPVTAVREVQEETGHAIRLVRRLNTARYPINSHIKVVQWWLAELASNEVVGHDKEADKVEWWPTSKAIRELSYDDDVGNVVQALREPVPTPLFIVRHAKAMNRKQWQGRDADRRLTERGRRQAKALSGLLQAFGVGELASSSSTRCMKTLTPYAHRAGLEIRAFESLSEEAAAKNPQGVLQAMSKLIKLAHKADRPLAICGHRPVLPAIFDALGVKPNHTLRPGEVAIVYVDPAMQPVDILCIAPRL
ncbi:MAG: NUDIX hydrolase [Propionibacterium sp.]|nr:NUDIX hydrolase [Propionibacterium sp.]